MTGESGDAVRDIGQKLLLGDIGEWGTGAIPPECIPFTRGRYGMAKGVSNLFDWVMVKHVSGGNSRIRFRQYSQDVSKWQGTTIHGIWFDEEPPFKTYMEGITRTNATWGLILLTYTPLKGLTNMTKRFIQEHDPNRIEVVMEDVDALHYSPEEREAIAASYPSWQREARTKGVPALGSGAVYPYPVDSYTVPAFHIPRHWPELAAIDIGITHPTAAVKLRWDRDADIIYVTHSYRASDTLPKDHVANLKHWGSELRWAWPRDMLQREKGTGIELAQTYKKLGLKMLPEHAQLPESAVSTSQSRVSLDGGITVVEDRFTSGRLKVFAHLHDLVTEITTYHRDEGKIVPEGDDLVDALRYGVISIRHAEAGQETGAMSRHRRVESPGQHDRRRTERLQRRWRGRRSLRHWRVHPAGC